MARVLIAGCGYVGTALADLLVADGHGVHCLRREVSSLPREVAPVEADLCDPATLTRLPAAEWVFYTAGAGASTEAAYRAAYVQGLSNLLRELDHQGAPVRRVVFTSSTAVFAQSSGEWVDETSPTEPVHFSGRTLLAAEGLLRDGPFPATVVRLAGIYGPGRETLARRVLRGEARAPGTPLFTNRIHRDDCAGALAHVMDVEDPAPVYLGVDHEPADLADVLAYLAERLGVEPPPVGEGSGESRRYRTHKRCRNDLLVRSGYAFKYPTYREGYEPIIQGLLREQ